MAGRGQKTGWTTRLQIYAVVMGIYYAYKYYKGELKGYGDNASTAAQSKETCTDDPTLKRRFSRVGAHWLSFLEVGACTNMQLILLHQTGLSAEAEFSTTIPQLLEAGPAGGLRVLAIDRPCHGYSPCLDEAESAKAPFLVGGLLGQRAASAVFSFMASGRDAARHVLSLVSATKIPARMLLLRPQLKTLDSKVSTSALATAETARWNALSGAKKEHSDAPLDVSSLPKACTVTIVYFEGDVEDDTLKIALEDENIAVEVRYVDSMEEGLVPAVADMLAGDGAATDEEV